MVGIEPTWTSWAAGRAERGDCVAGLGRVYVLHRKRVSCWYLNIEYRITLFGQYTCERRTSRMVDSVTLM